MSLELNYCYFFFDVRLYTSIHTFIDAKFNENDSDRLILFIGMMHDYMRVQFVLISEMEDHLYQIDRIISN